ncbi:receptor-like protein EIX2 [Mercurialis annua]|uniref:receptor-like protein EIX2 n=1 Tax=Mercurialis annua TaxID=3986 RepID=UPI00215FC821|nr:receptor-like protein EIX2 [Mercurialis annua]
MATLCIIDYWSYYVIALSVLLAYLSTLIHSRLQVIRTTAYVKEEVNTGYLNIDHYKQLILYFSSASLKLYTMRIWSLVFLGLLISATNYCTSPCHGNTSVLCIESERQALLRFKQDLMDPDNRLNSWSAAELDCCNWTGIVCDSLTGHVQELNLSYSESEYDQGRSMFNGSINLSLLELKHLKLLDLSYNNFGGNPIPSFIGSLVSLRYLKLSMAGFKGLVPHQLGNLSSLHYLVVEGNYERDGQNSLYVDNLDWLSSMHS